MADHVGELDDRDASLELFHHKSVAEIVDFGAVDAGDAEVAVNGGTNVADQKGVTSFGDKEGSVLGFGSASDIFFDGSFGGSVKRDFPGFVTFEGADFEIGFFERNILKLDPGELANAQPSLE